MVEAGSEGACLRKNGGGYRMMSTQAKDMVQQSWSQTGGKSVHIVFMLD